MYEISDLRVSYGGRTVLDLEQLTIAPGRFTVILGQNGSGKSTLMKILARQQSAGSGRVLLKGRPIGEYSQAEFARTVAYLPQNLPEAPGLDTKALCRLGRYPWRGAFARWRPEDDRIVADCLKAMNVEHYAGELVDHLSGGERQRGWIAMALAQKADCVLLDEPVSALDVAHQIEVVEHLSRQNKETGIGVVAILHDINLAARYADEIVTLKQGRLAFKGASEDLLDSARLRELFGHPFSIARHPRDDRLVALSD
ncbi:ABC transporter ATP-binding protein [Nisaea acidiphila]|uniref:ABC transporter ATP-binding protein n=1 Tax=Nisaea acidiphila TaxID=1862145 RepID=A0A9J7AUS7_9PROT|nr:ABC transporter ATP-binding protein [Nisaea acidiphila]UUX51079.1 ABC transporter ATP-binding protein [Nisaea acidiphila]